MVAYCFTINTQAAPPNAITPPCHSRCLCCQSALRKTSTFWFHDPRNNHDSLRDIAISKGRIAAITAKYKDSVDDAVEAGKRANIPVMVDFGYFLPRRLYHELVGKYLRPGLDQIVTPPSKQ